jgi:undecaprenyl-diphosphatase
MTFFDALILGILEGLTEFLPISSTGHLILASHILNIPDSDFLKTFEIAIQLGAIAAVAVVSGTTLVKNRELAKRVFVAFIPTGIIGFLLYKLIKGYLIGNEMVVVVALFVGGIFMILCEIFLRRTAKTKSGIEMISYPKALLIGVFQAIAIIPGTSRSAMTILGGLALGLSRTAIVEFSFLLAIPTMVAATGYDIMKNRELLSGVDVGLLVLGLVAAFASASVALRLFLAFVKLHTFIGFGIYRIVIAFFFWLIFFN